jgi:hypothetical protein
MKTLAITATAWLTAMPLLAQVRPAQAPRAPVRTAKAAAPVDLTGNWVSLITEDWRWRMVMPAKGDYASVPINAEAKRVADAWDPVKDESTGEPCRAFGAAGIMRMPTRLRISWLDDSTLKVETDAGTQTRLLHFGSWKPGTRPTWQGDSSASWEVPRNPVTQEPDARATSGSLKVVTTNMRPGYLRRNGIPYSANARLTEYWDLHKGRNNEQWLVVSTIVEDPAYLQIPWMTSPNFKKEPDGSKWDPAPCTAGR